MNATKTGYELCSELHESLKAEYAAKGLELTFGYIGNCNNHYDDRSWYFFTNVPSPTGGCFKFGGHGTEGLEALHEAAKTALKNFLDNRVLPHVAGRWRKFKIEGENAGNLRPAVEAIGGSYGSHSQNYGLFSIRFVGLEDLKKKFPGYNITEN